MHARLLSFLFMASLLLGSGSPSVASALPARQGNRQQWGARFDDPLHSLDAAVDVDVNPGGDTVYVTGGAGHDPSTGEDFATIAYRTQGGRPLWLSWYNGFGTGWDQALALAVAPDGSAVFVTGWSTQPDSYSYFDYATVAYDPVTGQQRWAARYDGPSSGNDSVEAVVASPDGARVFVTGWSAGLDGLYDITTIAYDAATGTELWVARTDLSECDLALSLAVSPDSTRVFATGESGCGGGPDDLITVAWDAITGQQLWADRFDRGDGQDIGKDVEVSPDSALVYVTGWSLGAATADTIAYDAATGAQRWVALKDHWEGDHLAVSPDGSSVYVTGVIASDQWKFGTAAYNGATGANIWIAGYDDGSSFNAPNDIAVAPDGRSVYVTGGGSQYDTVAYEASTGIRRWVAVFEQGSSETPFALAISPDSSLVFVTGRVYGPTDQDYATIAYRTGGG